MAAEQDYYFITCRRVFLLEKDVGDTCHALEVRMLLLASSQKEGSGSSPSYSGANQELLISIAFQSCERRLKPNLFM